MKLSEAILLGSVGTEQGKGNYSMWLDSPRKCALGAALVAVGQCPSKRESPRACLDHPYIIARQLWPFIVKEVTHPLRNEPCRIIECIYSLNDAGWTRPQIAAWVATIEPHIDERKCETNEVSAQDEVVAAAVPETESQTVRN